MRERSSPEKTSSPKEAAKLAALAFLLSTQGCQEMINEMKARGRQQVANSVLEANARILEAAAQRGTPRRFEEAIDRELPPTHADFEANDRAVAMTNVVTVQRQSEARPGSNAAALEERISVRMGASIRPHAYAATEARRLAIQIPIMQGGHFRVTGYSGICEITQPRTDHDNRFSMYMRLGSLTERLLSTGAETDPEQTAEGQGATYAEAVQQALLNIANPSHLMEELSRTAHPSVGPDGKFEHTGFITNPPHAVGSRTVYSCGHHQRAQTIAIHTITEEVAGGSRPCVTVHIGYRTTQEPPEASNNP